MTTASLSVSEALEILEDLGANVGRGNNGEYFCTCVRCKAGGALRVKNGTSPREKASISCTKCGVVDLESVRVQREELADAQAEADDALVLSDKALHGVIGDYVRLRAPHTEVSVAPILFATLATLATLIGPRPRWRFGDTDHHTVLFILIVGSSGAGRKGSATNLGVYGLLELIDHDFLAAKVRSGLSSGEGLIAEIRDATPDREDAKGRVVVGDTGITDKRLLIVESEFGSVLESQAREGNRLSAVVRDLWDSRTVRTLVKLNPQAATNPHVGIVGAITPAELVRRLGQLSIDNGFANRFLPVYSTRVRLIPGDSSPDPAEIARVAGRLSRAVCDARTISTMGWTSAASDRWEPVYRVLSVPDTSSERLRTLIQRGAPMVRRIAMIYALMDGSRNVDVVHLEAALAVWEYGAATWRKIFSEIDYRTPLARRIADAIEGTCAAGLSRTGIRKASGSNNIPKEAIEAALDELRRSETIFKKRYRTEGRTEERWFHSRYRGEEYGAGVQRDLREQWEESPPTIVLAPSTETSPSALPSLPSLPSFPSLRSIPSPFDVPAAESVPDQSAQPTKATTSKWGIAK